jgi:hypothetical protein
MDRIPAALAKKPGAVVRLTTEVTAIKRRDNGVTIAYTGKRSGKRNFVERPTASSPYRSTFSRGSTTISRPRTVTQP